MTSEYKPAPPGAPKVRETFQIPAGAFKDICLQLMDEVNEHPREYVITKHGRPVAKLVPPDAEAASPFGYLAGTLVAQQDIVAPDFEAWGAPE